ncbi:MAG: 23S rRNA (pseudouridine(1915)-N(3))-methyltransferase RlmH [Betaproteobacteria bacterium]|nr:50S rRNA methyltransferase [Betaproteobacteria bacterium UKL13-2]HCG52564.1 23S rRNA (pseudouridine(1915)-N(3))-methyltransferase RlmH [Betaproteobacteria bacterium]
MKIYILALGHKLPPWINAGIEEYTKRMPPEARIEIIELKPEDRTSKTTNRVLALEAERILAAMPKGATPIVCDERGKTLTTPMLSRWMGEWMQGGVSPCFIIGSADGLADPIRRSAAHTIALSGCVLPHGMVRVILAEQLYRAWSLLHNHPYHRE